MATRVVLAEDNALLRQGLTRLFATANDLELIATVGDLHELLDVTAAQLPEVVITDIRMPPTHTDEGIRAAGQLRASHPTIGVVVLSQYASPNYAMALFADGTAGRAYLLKDRVSDVDQLFGAVRTVATGGSVIDPQVVEALVAGRTRSSRRTFPELTPRELEVLAEMAQGKTNSAIAGALYLSERAVEKHINALFTKLHLSEEQDVNRRVKAVLLYLAEQATPDD